MHFLFKIFSRSHSTEKLPRGESFSVSLISGTEKFYPPECFATIFDFLSKFFCPTVPKISSANPSVLCFGKIPVAKKFLDKGGVEHQDFPSKNVCLTVP